MNKIKENRLHDFMSEELAVPNMDKVESNRGYMWGSHFSQSVNLKNPESPLVFTNFENQFGEYSDLGFFDAKEDFEVLGKLRKNENVYFLFVHYLESDTYDLIERREDFWLTEKYGFTFNNECIDSLEEKDVVEKDTRLYKCFNYDEEDNFMYGVNLNTIYYTNECKTLEDAIVLSETAAHKLGTYNVQKIKVVLNDNDLLLNLNKNDDDVYRCFPLINEHVDRFLCVRRRIAYKNLYEFDNLSIETLQPEDEAFYGEGKVVDIDIYSNLEEKQLNGVYNKPLKNLLRKKKAFNREFLKLIEPYVINEFEKCSDELIQEYNLIKKESNKVPFTNDNSQFSGIVLQFTILKFTPVMNGSKLTARYGNKGCVSDIQGDGTENYFDDVEVRVMRDSEMPMIIDGPMKGQRAEICLNPLGIIGRVNVGQNYEHELNFISKWIKWKMKEAEDRKSVV